MQSCRLAPLQTGSLSFPSCPSAAQRFSSDGVTSWHTRVGATSTRSCDADTQRTRERHDKKRVKTGTMTDAVYHSGSR